jgi:UDPglucose--hexose-1-phosphate uridylyltransferase
MEISVYPLRHYPFFERTPKKDLAAVVALLKSALRRIRKHLNDPDLNFFIHTAPIRDQKKYSHYHWHIDVVPKILIPAGFELSTGVDINIVDPDWLAKTLRGKR